MQTIDRRAFLQTSGSLTIGFALFGCLADNASTPAITYYNPSSASGHPLPPENRIDAWLQVLDDGRVRILTGKMELGQGLTTIMQQVAGEELNLPPHQVEVVLADTGRTPDEGLTAGSRSAERSAITVRQAAAAAREQLLGLAAEQWQAPAAELSLREGRVVHSEKGQLAFHELLSGRQLSSDIPRNVTLKPKDQYQWVGRPVPHPDMEKIVRGEPLYVQDLRFPDMVHARVVRPAGYGARLQSWERTAEQIPGVLKVVENGSFLGILAEDEFVAIRAWQLLNEKTEWQSGPELPKVTAWADFLLEEGGGRRSGGSEEFTHQAVYTKPYIMHASIGPSCAVARFEDGKLQVWSHTQGVYPLRSTISDLTGLAEDDIRVTGVRGSGCYGHNGADDVAADAALLAMAMPGRHVRLQWQREDEHRWEPYGSAMRLEISARLSPEGRIERWRYDLWSDTHSTRPHGDAGNFASAQYLDKPFSPQGRNSVGGGTRNAEPYYDLPDAQVQDHYVQGPLRSSALRSLGAYANIFAIECFMDELAEKAGQDPLDFRLSHLSDERAVAVINRLREVVGEEPTGAGEGIGYGFSRYKNSASYCAVAAKVQIDQAAETVRAVKLWAVIDAGETLNPDGLINQTEGGLIQAASWTLLEEVRFDRTGVTSKDWLTYPIMRFDQSPETEVVIIDRPDQPPLGAGEAAQGPAGAAIVNAVYQASGKRVRDLPVVRALFGGVSEKS